MCQSFHVDTLMPVRATVSTTRTVICRNTMNEIFLGYYNIDNEVWEICDNYFYAPTEAVIWKPLTI